MFFQKKFRVPKVLVPLRNEVINVYNQGPLMLRIKLLMNESVYKDEVKSRQKYWTIMQDVYLNIASLMFGVTSGMFFIFHSITT